MVTVYTPHAIYSNMLISDLNTDVIYVIFSYLNKRDRRCMVFLTMYVVRFCTIFDHRVVKSLMKHCTSICGIRLILDHTYNTSFDTIYPALSRMDATMSHISGSNVQTLIVSGQNLTDAGLKCLIDCPKLERLCIDGARLTPDGVQYLSRLNKLHVLVYFGFHITQDLVSVMKSQGLRELYVFEELDLQGDEILQIRHVTSARKHCKWLNPRLRK